MATTTRGSVTTVHSAPRQCQQHSRVAAEIRASTAGLLSTPLSPNLACAGMLIFLANAICAFMLNCTVFMLIGNTSALTMNISGVVKDWILIYLSWWIFGSPVSPLSLGGYFVAFGAVLYYNYMKLTQMKTEDTRKHDPAKGRKAAVRARGGGRI